MCYAEYVVLPIPDSRKTTLCYLKRKEEPVAVRTHSYRFILFELYGFYYLFAIPITTLTFPKCNSFFHFPLIIIVICM